MYTWEEIRTMAGYEPGETGIENKVDTEMSQADFDQLKQVKFKQGKKISNPFDTNPPSKEYCESVGR